jgi:hypothetical protein
MTLLAFKYIGEQAFLTEEKSFFSSLKLPPFTPAGFDPTTHSSAGGGDTARPRRQGMPRNKFCAERFSSSRRKLYTNVLILFYWLQVSH